MITRVAMSLTILGALIARPGSSAEPPRPASQPALEAPSQRPIPVVALPPAAEPRRVELDADPEYATGRRKRTLGIVLACVFGAPGLGGISVGSALINSYRTRLYPTKDDERQMQIGAVIMGIGAASLLVAAAAGGSLIYVGDRQMERRRAALLRAPRVSLAPTLGGAALGLSWTY